VVRERMLKGSEMRGCGRGLGESVHRKCLQNESICKTKL